MNKEKTLANDLTPASAMHPGLLLMDELEARGMKHIELARSLGIAKNVMSEILHGKRNISPLMAIRLEKVLGIKAEFWMRYQVGYELDKIRIESRELV